MIKELENLVDKIEECATELEQIEIKVNEIDNKRLQDIIQIALKGLKFEKIYSSKRTFNANGFNHRDDDIEFFTENGKYLRGILVDSYWIKENSYGTGKEGSKSELWLMSDGTFRQFNKYINESYFQGDSCKYSRSTNELIMIAFNVDDIIKSIENALKERLTDLGKRTKTQQERLNKIEQFRIKD